MLTGLAASNGISTNAVPYVIGEAAGTITATVAIAAVTGGAGGAAGAGSVGAKVVGEAADAVEGAAAGLAKIAARGNDLLKPGPWAVESVASSGSGGNW